MTRKDIEQYVQEKYGYVPEYLWFKFPNYAVYRHKESGKWFAVVMDLSKRKFGIDEDGIIDVMNIKCDAALIGSLLLEQGFFPAYHMNKGSWVSIMLDGRVDKENIEKFIDMSYGLTMKKVDYMEVKK